MFDWNFINEKLLNSVEREEFEYWKSIAEQASEIGLDFAEETYLEDLKNGGGELQWDTQKIQKD